MCKIKFVKHPDMMAWFGVGPVSHKEYAIYFTQIALGDKAFIREYRVYRNTVEITPPTGPLEFLNEAKAVANKREFVRPSKIRIPRRRSA